MNEWILVSIQLTSCTSLPVLQKYLKANLYRKNPQVYLNLNLSYFNHFLFTRTLCSTYFHCSLHILSNHFLQIQYVPKVNGSSLEAIFQQQAHNRDLLIKCKDPLFQSSSFVFFLFTYSTIILRQGQTSVPPTEYTETISFSTFPNR